MLRIALGEQASLSIPRYLSFTGLRFEGLGLEERPTNLFQSMRACSLGDRGLVKVNGERSRTTRNREKKCICLFDLGV